MKRRSKAGGEPIKGRRRKAPEPERRNAPKTVPRSKASPPGEQTEVARLTRERDEALEQQAARLCRAKTSGIFRLEGGHYRLAAASGLFDPAYFEIERQALITPGPGTVVGRAAMNRQVVRSRMLGAIRSTRKRRMPN